MSTHHPEIEKLSLAEYVREVNKAKAENQTTRTKYAGFKKLPYPPWSWFGPSPSETEIRHRRRNLLDWEVNHGGEKPFKLSPELRTLLTLEK